ncbi:hypothetical protein N657DRAFT_482630 [Parathielavia appendiculata]|uniref:CAP-Gly domain-containing protein n=1 Tax=Parathielavia appendiculata TaxID=2587402 RepID=A0AAN6TY54_9PEZI|nr:hypothetical protein N657DRAFT_482630 [Parathielavia appendiculata]
MSWSEFTEGRKVQLNDSRKGTIRYAGHTLFAPGLWIGVELEDASGKNDGSVNNHRYFDCPMGHGMFVRPAALKLLAGPPAPFMPQPAKKTRPSSTSMASSRVSTPADPGLPKRMSLNNPSPTPGQKPARTPSGIRVSLEFPLFTFRRVSLPSTLCLPHSPATPRHARHLADFILASSRYISPRRASPPRNVRHPADLVVTSLLDSSLSSSPLQCVALGRRVG